MRPFCLRIGLLLFLSPLALLGPAWCQTSATDLDLTMYLEEVPELSEYLHRHAAFLAPRHTPALLNRNRQASVVATDLELKMDSIVGPEERKQVYAYNAEGFLTELIQSFYQIFTATFTPEIRIAFTYDGNMNPASELLQNWNAPAGVWANDLLTDYLHDDNGNRVLRAGMSWSESLEDWTFFHRTEWEYDEDQRIVLERRFALSGGTIFPFQEDAFYYSANGRLDSTVTMQQSPSNFQWNLNSRDIYTYEDELLIEVLTEGWNGQIQDWYPQGLSEYAYPNDNEQELTLFQWNAAGGVWFSVSRVHTAFDSAGNETEVLFYIMEGATWRPVFGYARTFDGFDNMLTYMEQAWSQEQQALATLREIAWDIDYAYTVDQLALPLWTLNLGFAHKPDGAQVTLFAEGAPSSENYETYYYSTAATLSDRNARAPEEVVLFPNPTHAYIQVHPPQATDPLHYVLYNLQGKALVQGMLTATGDDKIYVGHLISGIYLLKLIHGSTTTTHKVVKQ